jgi:outer membrane receptor protein involved in Fe transport
LRIAAQTRGNLNLEPQTSTAESLGVTFKPIQNLTLTLDWWHFTFEKLITTETATQLVNFDPTGAITGRVKRDPATNALLSVVLQYYNAPEMTTAGYDFGADYNVKFDKYGNLRLNLSGTYIDEYQLTQLTGLAPINAAGRSNDGVAGASPNTRFRANFRTTWSGGNHSLTALLHYYAPLKFTLDPSYEIESWMPLDITYNYSLPTSIFGKDTRLDSLQLSLGATNVLDESEPYVPFPGFQPFIPSLYDLRGQIFWGSIVAKF